VADDKIVIQIQLDDGTVKQGFIDIKKNAEDAGKGVNTSMSGGAGGVSALTRSLNPLVLGLAAVAGAALALNKAFNLMSDSIKEAAESEVNISRLNTALAATGQYTFEASNGLQDYATELQNTTTFSDDAVLSTQSLLIQIGRLGADQVPRATEATANLASALRIDLESAARLVGKAAEGNVSAFQRYGVEIRKGTTDSETFANTLKALEQRFGGAAAAELNTYSGSLKQLGNLYGNLQEEIGNIVVKSPTAIAIIKVISQELVNAANAVKNFVGGRDLIDGMVKGFVQVGGAITSFVILPLERLSNVGNVLFDIYAVGTQGIVTGWANVGFAITKVLNLTGVVSDAALESARTFTESSKSLLIEYQGDLVKSVESLAETPLTDALQNKLIDLQDKINEAKNNLASTTPTNAPMGPAMPEFGTTEDIGVGPLEALGLAADGAKQKLMDLRQSTQANFKAMGAAAITALSGAVGNAFAGFGKALASGENAVKAFAKAFIGAIGGMLIQLGQGYILQGIAASANPLAPGSGAGLIAAGAALATFGGILSAIGGGGGGAAGGSGVSAETPTSVPTQDLNQLEQEKPGNQIEVNIQGDVMDSTDTGLRIVDIIKQYGDLNGNDTVTT